MCHQNHEVKISQFPPSKMNAQIQKLELDNENVHSFFENIIKAGAEYEDCNQILSLLLERCSQEKCLDSLFPTISDVAQRIQDVQASRMPKNHLVESIH